MWEYVEVIFSFKLLQAAPPDEEDGHSREARTSFWTQNGNVEECKTYRVSHPTIDPTCAHSAETKETSAQRSGGRTTG